MQRVSPFGQLTLKATVPFLSLSRLAASLIFGALRSSPETFSTAVSVSVLSTRALSVPAPPLMACELSLRARMLSSPSPRSTSTLISAARPLLTSTLSSPPSVLRSSVSVVPMSRKNGAWESRVAVTRWPFAETMKCSGTAPPLSTAMSVPAPPSITSEPSPGFQVMVSSLSPPFMVSLPLPGVSVSLPASPFTTSLPSVPPTLSVPVPALIVTAMPLTPLIG